MQASAERLSARRATATTPELGAPALPRAAPRGRLAVVAKEPAINKIKA